ncbi:MAG: sigma-70 family RNA polymerase sigma factor [Odoribacter splanchnicus]|nr:sigma-70 family RNA polymerase sigma factor [Odoribacter splanchnicus]
MRQLKITKQITGRESYSIEKYLQEIGKIHVLSPDEEANLAKKIKSGDGEARERLVLSNLRFVVSVAKQYQNHGLTLGDLINEGNMGLIKAAECFDETKGFKFISYAVWWIRQSILQAIAENARLIRLPLNKISTINKVNRYFTELEQEYQREPTVEEIAEKMDITPTEVKENMKIANRPVSMDAPLTTDEESINLYDVYISSDEEAQGPEAILNRDSLKKDIERSFQILSDREATILSMYYGLGGYSSMSLEEIGTKLGLTSERVRQVKTKAIKKLKEVKNNKRLKTYL